MKRSALFAALAVAALSAPAAFADLDQHAAHLQEKMKEMQGQVDRARETTDPAERQKLVQEHLQSMQATMQVMRGMGGSMMTSGRKHGMTDGDMMNRHDMTEKRIDMMQMVMEQMMQHGQMMQPMPAR